MIAIDLLYILPALHDRMLPFSAILDQQMSYASKTQTNNISAAAMKPVTFQHFSRFVYNTLLRGSCKLTNYYYTCFITLLKHI